MKKWLKAKEDLLEKRFLGRGGRIKGEEGELKTSV